MKKHILEFLHRGCLSCGGGPIILSIVYIILYYTGTISEINVDKIAIEYLTVTLLAFVAGGISIIYTIEELPLSIAILIHGLVLYVDYIVIYLSNGWLENNWISFVVFTVCFVLGYIIIWIIIYLTNKNDADKLNKLINKE